MSEFDEHETAMREDVDQPPRHDMRQPRPARNSARSASPIAMIRLVASLRAGVAAGRSKRRQPGEAMQRLGPAARRRRLVEDRAFDHLHGFAVETEAASQQRVGILKPARQRRRRDERRCDPASCPCSKPPIEPGPPPADAQRPQNAASSSAVRYSGRSARGGQCRLVPFSDTYQPRNRAMLAA